MMDIDALIIQLIESGQRAMDEELSQISASLITFRFHSKLDQSEELSRKVLEAPSPGRPLQG